MPPADHGYGGREVGVADGVRRVYWAIRAARSGQCASLNSIRLRLRAIRLRLRAIRLRLRAIRLRLRAIRFALFNTSST